MESVRIPSREEFRRALVQKQGEEIVQKLEQATVAICGVGGLGSNVAINLARAGIKKLILVDFDRVDVTNLQRQQYKASQVGEPKAFALVENLKEIAPYTEFEAYDEKITEENIDKFVANADVVCEAFDNPETKSMLVNAVLEKYPQVREMWDPKYGDPAFNRKYGQITQCLAACRLEFPEDCALPALSGRVFEMEAPKEWPLGTAGD